MTKLNLVLLGILSMCVSTQSWASCNQVNESALQEFVGMLQENGGWFTDSYYREASGGVGAASMITFDDPEAGAGSVITQFSATDPKSFVRYVCFDAPRRVLAQ